MEDAKKIVEQTRLFIGRISAPEVVLDGPFKPQELGAILIPDAKSARAARLTP